MAGTKFKAENGLLVTGANSEFTYPVTVSANVTVSGDLFYLGGNLYVAGQQIIVGNTIYDTDILPASTTGRSVGNTTHRFDGNFRNTSVSGNLTPTANNKQLGSGSSRWDVFAYEVSSANTVIAGGEGSFGGNLTSTGRMLVNNTAAVGNTTVTGSIVISTTANVSGVATFSSNVVSNGDVIATGAGSFREVVTTGAAFGSNTKTVTSTGNNIIDSFPKASNYCAKYVVSVNRANTALHAIELLLVHDNTNVLLTKYGEVYNTSLGTFDAAVNGANVEVYFSPTSANTYSVKVSRQRV